MVDVREGTTFQGHGVRLVVLVVSDRLRKSGNELRRHERANEEPAW